MTSKVALAFMKKQLADETLMVHKLMNENHNLKTKLAQATRQIDDLRNMGNGLAIQVMDLTDTLEKERYPERTPGAASLLGEPE
jgi:uncharacterized protein with PhoU and TrkA domain